MMNKYKVKQDQITSFSIFHSLSMLSNPGLIEMTQIGEKSIFDNCTHPFLPSFLEAHWLRTLWSQLTHIPFIEQQ